MNCPKILKTFFGFAFFSGLGWFCDFATYVLLVEAFSISPFAANFFSSYVGVTFVYFTSLHLVFNRVAGRHSLFLSVYWGYQFVSILVWSALLNVVVQMVETQFFVTPIIAFAGIVGKIIITPANLLSNFIFMKFLTGFMNAKEATSKHA